MDPNDDNEIDQLKIKIEQDKAKFKIKKASYDELSSLIIDSDDFDQESQSDLVKQTERLDFQMKLLMKRISLNEQHLESVSIAFNDDMKDHASISSESSRPQPQLMALTKTIPANQLPKYTPSVDLENFFAVTEAKLLSAGIPEKEWYRALGLQTSDSELLWVSKEILSKPCTWKEAKERFTNQYQTHTHTIVDHKAKLLSMKQSTNESCFMFLRKVEHQASRCNQDLNDSTFIMTIMVRFFNEECKEEGARAAAYSNFEYSDWNQFVNLSRTIDQIIDSRKKKKSSSSSSTIPSISNATTATTQASGAKPTKTFSTRRPCQFPGCNSTEHHISRCPKRLALECSYCGRKGHTAEDCRSKARNTKDKDKDITCYNCGEKGHLRPDCPHRNRDKNINSNEVKKPLRALRFSQNEFNSSSETLLTDDDIQELKASRCIHKVDRSDVPPLTESDNYNDPILAPCLINDIKVFLEVDSGALCSSLDIKFVEELKLSIIPPSKPSSLTLAVDNISIPRTGSVIISELKTEHHTLYDVEFEVAAQAEALYPAKGLLGRDIFHLLGIRIVGVPTNFPTVDNNVLDIDDMIDAPKNFNHASFLKENQVPSPLREQLLSTIAPLLEENAKMPPSTFCNHPSAILYLETGEAPPVYVPQYPLSEFMQPFVDEQIKSWSSNGIIEPAPADSPWNVPLLGVLSEADRRKGKSPRICIDPRKINALLPSDPRPIPSVDAVINSLQGFEYISEIDLTKSFNQIEIAEADRIKTTFTWNGTRWMFRGCPFGLKPLSQLFQNIIEQVIYDLRSFSTSFIDNIYVQTRTSDFNDHILQTCQLISRLTAFGLRINPDKSHWAYFKIVALGHVVSKDSRQPDPAKVQAFLDWPTPATGRDIQRLLGFLNFLRDHIPLYAKLTAVLEPLRNHRRLGQHWTPACDRAFSALKQALCHAATLWTPLPNVPYSMSVDASQFGLGLALYQDIEPIRYILFAAKALNKAQRNYSATRRELLAIVWALQRCRYFLFGRHFTLYTDHKALTFLFTQQHVNYMILNWLDTLLDYDFTIVHCPGVLNVLPDALSRIYQKYDRATQEECDANVANIKLATVRINEQTAYTDKQLYEFINERFNKNFVPEEDRSDLLVAAHNKGHFGADNIFKELWNMNFYWPNMRRDCTKHVAECVQCLRYNVGKSGYHPQQFIVAKLPFEHIAVDTAGGYETTSSGNNVIVVIQDICTRFRFVRAQPSKSAKDTAWTLWLCFSTFPIPKIMQSDNGSEYINEVIKELTTMMGVDHRRIAAYNPRANGSAENSVKAVQQTLLKITKGIMHEWDSYLPAVQMALNTKINPSLKSSPASLVFGMHPNDFANYSRAESKLLNEQELLDRINMIQKIVRPEVHKIFVKTQEKRTAASNARLQLVKPIAIGDQVMWKSMDRKNKHEPKWLGPYEVVDFDGNNYSLKDPQGHIYKNKPPRDQLKLIKGHINTSQEFLVEQILDHKGPVSNRQFLIKWKGYSDESNTWEPEENLNCQRLMNQYWHNLKSAEAQEPPPIDVTIDTQNRVAVSHAGRLRRPSKIRFVGS